MVKPLGRLTLLRNIYRALINSGRTYAAFEENQVAPILERLEGCREILDPMAGYCTLLTYCSKIGVRTVCIEYNPPEYLWGILINPANSASILKIIEDLLNMRRKWPTTRKVMQVSSWCFPDLSLELIQKLFILCQRIASVNHLNDEESKKLSLALLLPFFGRLSSTVASNMVTHVKIGGICVYEGWHEDFQNYLEVINSMLKRNILEAKTKQHQLLLDDCITIKLPRNRFPAMITSPPYPNYRDYSCMFAPEIALLEWLENKGVIQNFHLKTRLIGSVEVSERGNLKKRKASDVRSSSARKFLRHIENYTGKKRAGYDNKIYYIPYFANYFSDLEKAYRNIACSFCRKFEGYIIVVNNTARGYVVPVAESIMETWRDLGFKSDIVDKMTREKFHVGGINPRARGIRAKHVEYTVKVWRD